MSKPSPPPQKPYARNIEIVDPSVFPEGMQRVALGVEYNGASFHGFQKQSHDPDTVQQYLESGFSQVAAEPITLVCAGRTDAGVHSTNQVVHFDTLAQRPTKAWTRGVNALLPDTIAVKWAVPVEPGFHARFSAHHRTYRYIICNRATRPALAYEQLTWVRESLDVDGMRVAAQYLVGEHDFSSFRASQCQARSPVRRVDYIHLAQRGELVVIEIRANAFLHHMVRNIVGVLLKVGLAEQPAEWVEHVLKAKDRRCAAATAKPHGLHLVAVAYPERFSLAAPAPGPAFCPEPLRAYGEP